MKIECPHCHRVNRVAGYFHEPERVAEGKADRQCYCGWCGRKFEPAQNSDATKVDVAMADGYKK